MKRLHPSDVQFFVRWLLAIVVGLGVCALALIHAAIEGCVPLAPYVGGEGVGATVQINDAPPRHRYDAGETP